MIEQLPYTDAHIAAYPVEYIAGIDLYNAGEFHAAHDVWEERWMGEVGQQEKLFLQAMIQSAVAFHHLEIGRPGAARQMYTRAKEKFDKRAETTPPRGPLSEVRLRSIPCSQFPMSCNRSCCHGLRLNCLGLRRD